MGVTMTTSIPDYPSGCKDQLKGTVIFLGHTAFILSSRPWTSTILWGEEGGRERNIRVLYFFSVFSVGEDHKLFSEIDILFLMQPVWGAEGGAHVHFWWTQLVSQRRKSELLGSKVSFGRSNGRRTGWQLIIEYPLWQAHYAVFLKLNATALVIIIPILQKRKQRLIKLQWLIKWGQTADGVIALELELRLFDSKDYHFSTIQYSFPVTLPSYWSLSEPVYPWSGFREEHKSIRMRT